MRSARSWRTAADEATDLGPDLTDDVSRNIARHANEEAIRPDKATRPPALRWWKPVAEMVIKGNSPKELYYRTGFDFDEIRAAVVRIPTAPGGSHD